MNTPGWPATLPSSWLRYDSGRSGELGTPQPNQSNGALRPLTPGNYGAVTAGTPEWGDGWDVAVLMWGTNDVGNPAYDDPLYDPDPVWQSIAFTDEDLVNALANTALTLRAGGTTVIVAAPPPILGSDWRNPRLENLRDRLAARMAAEQIPFVDFYAAFSALPNAADYYVPGDPVHWDADGSARAAEMLVEAIRVARPDAPL